jgi:hypothetical protein
MDVARKIVEESLIAKSKVYIGGINHLYTIYKFVFTIKLIYFTIKIKYNMTY